MCLLADLSLRLRLVLYPILANRLLLNLRDTTDYTTRTAVSNILFHASRFDDLEIEEDLQQVVARYVPEEPEGQRMTAGQDGGGIEDEASGPSSAVASGVESRMSGSLRHNGSMV